MSKIVLKGFLESVTKVETFANKSGNGETKICRIRVMVPGWVDQFGEKKGEDQIFEIRVMNSRIDELPFVNSIKSLTTDEAKVEEHQKVECSCYLNARFVSNETKSFYTLELALHELKLL